VASSLPWIAATAAVAGAGTEIYTILWITALQREFDRDVLGRVMAINSLASLAFGPLGLVLTGPIADTIGARPVLLFGAAIAVACPIALVRVPGVITFGEALEPGTEASAGYSTKTAATAARAAAIRSFERIRTPRSKAST
jgi:MFS family permease